MVMGLLEGRVFLPIHSKASPYTRYKENAFRFLSRLEAEMAAIEWVLTFPAVIGTVEVAKYVDLEFEDLTLR